MGNSMSKGTSAKRYRLPDGKTGQVSTGIGDEVKVIRFTSDGASSSDPVVQARLDALVEQGLIEQVSGPKAQSAPKKASEYAKEDVPDPEDPEPAAPAVEEES